MEDPTMRYALLLLLVAACGGPGIEDSEDTEDTEETDDTEDTEVDDPWQATFWALRDGAWVEDLATIDDYVGGLSKPYGVQYVGAGTGVLQWAGGSWSQVEAVDREAPGAIGAYSGNGSDHYIAVGAQLYSWTNPGVWARWLEPAPGGISAISVVGSTRTVAVGSQLYNFSTYDDTWYTTLLAAPADIQCIIGIGGEEPQTYIIAGTTSYQWIEEEGWVATDTPAAPFPLVGGCAMDGEGNLFLVTNKLLE